MLRDLCVLGVLGALAVKKIILETALAGLTGRSVLN
jgi:hypothetical protein